MHPLMGDLIEPAADVGIGRRHVQDQSGALERGGQRRDEAALEVAVEALDLALGLGPVGATDPRAKAVLLGQRRQGRMPAMPAVTVGVALGNDGAGVIEQRLFGDAAKIDKRLSRRPVNHASLSSRVEKRTKVARL